MKNGIQCISACDKCHDNLCNNCEKAADDDITDDEESYQTVCFFDNDDYCDEELVDVENKAMLMYDDEMDDENLTCFSKETFSK